MKTCKNSQEVQIYGRLHADKCNVPQLLFNVVKMQMKLTKARLEFYLLSTKEDAKVYFELLEALLFVKRFKPSPPFMTAHNEALLEGYPLRYNLTKI